MPRSDLMLFSQTEESLEAYENENEDSDDSNSFQVIELD